ncbi:MAG TPA: DUF2520 domain-containing protein [Bacteroidales bacterium]|nr:DUF2520 domain-containing protein [Bacteroidales bacterium]
MNFENLPIYIIGSGNVAWNLISAFSKAGIHINGCWSRNKKTCIELSNQFNISYLETDEIYTKQGVFILTVSDSAIESISNRIGKTSIVVHTSGTTDLETLLNGHPNCGVFYPLQTFSKKETVDFSTIPVLIEYSSEEVKNLLEFWAQKLHSKYYFCSSPDRMKYHVAAVYACNFVNHMLALSEFWLRENNLIFDILEPLISETIRKAMQNGAFASQTGPAIRNDQITIEKHINLLANHPDLKKIYSFVTESIIEFHFKQGKHEF